MKRRLHYDPLTGIFTWLITPNNRVLVGSVAGHISKWGHYLVIEINKKVYQSHRLAVLYMTGKWPSEQVDHRDHNRQHNWWSNLQEASHTDNQKNRSKNSKSGHTGVSWDKPTKKWHAQIGYLGKQLHLGFYIELKDAVTARKKAEKIYNYTGTSAKLSPHI